MSRTQEIVEKHRDRHDRLMHEAIDNRMASDSLEKATEHQQTAMEHAHKAAVLDAVLKEIAAEAEGDTAE